jgi:histidinol-phosphate aminotransferase
MKNLKWLKNLDYAEYSYQSSNGEYPLDLSLNDYEGSTSIFLPVLKKSITSVGEYSFAQNKELINKIRLENFGLKNNQISITAGADGALRVIFHAILSQSSNKTICIPIPSFSRYEYHAKVNDAEIDFFKNSIFPFSLNINSLVTHLKKTKPSCLVLANPNNPTGLYIRPKDIEILLKEYSGFIILDEALLFNGLKGMHLYTKKYKNLIIIRTFSKLYGIAGERIGYMITHEDIAPFFRQLLSPFEVSSISIELAKVVISDQDTMESRTLELEESIRFIKNNLPNDYEISPTNSSVFLLKSKKKTKLYKKLLDAGVKTVSCLDFRGIEADDIVRISIKDLKSMQKLFSILERL